MALTAQQAYILSKKYTEETVEGAGAIKGKNCVIDSITDIAETPTKPAGQRVTFKWTLDSGVEQTDTMDVYNGNDGKGISRIYINDNDHFIVVYDDGTEEDCGEVVVYSSVDSVNGKTGVVELELPDVVTVGDNLTYNSETNTLSANAQQITVDSALSSVSENPVQNKVITHVISRLNTDISQEISARQRIDEQIQLAISTLITGVDAAQTKTLVTPLVIDGSTATTVEGALGALNNKTVDVDDALSNVSENPVQNKVVKGALDGKQVDVGLSIVNGKICVTYDVEVTENGQTVTQTVVRPILLDTTGANIVTSLNAIATALQGGDISATSSLPTASIDYVDSIKLLIGTQSGYETGGIYQCTESGGIYSWTLLNGSGGGSGTGGHTIEDGSGIAMTARSNLQFTDASVTDDSSNNRTVVSVAGKADKVRSATENNLAKLDANGNLADSGVADTSLVHKTGNETIGGTKTFTDEIISKSTGISPLNLVSGSSSTETWLKYTKGTDNSTLGLIGVKSNNKPYFYDSSAKRIALLEEVDAITNVATVESTTIASKAYAVGERLVLSGVLYKVTSAITSGGTIVTSGAGQNVSVTTVDAEISDKADKVASATNGNFAGLDSNGNLTDSGHKHSDYLTSHQDISGKANLTELASNFSEQLNYNAGQYVTYNGHTYRFKAAKAFGAWDATKVDPVQIAGEYVTAGRKMSTNVGNYATAEGADVTASGIASHASGYETIAQRRSQTVIGEYNEADNTGADGTAKGKYVFIVGIGDENDRANGFTIDWDGKAEAKSLEIADGATIYKSIYGFQVDSSGIHMYAGPATGVNITPTALTINEPETNLSGDLNAGGEVKAFNDIKVYSSVNDNNVVRLKAESGNAQFYMAAYNTTSSALRDVTVNVSATGSGGELSVIPNNASDVAMDADISKFGTIDVAVTDKIHIKKEYNSTTDSYTGGNLEVEGIVTVNGSDYAEKFEEAEDCPVCRFVTLDGEKIRLAQPEDDYILGVTSEAPAIVGDMSNDGKPVGLIGKLWVEHDGTAKVNGYVTCGDDGIATESEQYLCYRVMAVDGNRCKILVK
jgi:hypothetical protein